MAEPTGPLCLQCGEPAQHESGWPARRAAYCCRCFNHDWPEQWLIAGQECGKERVLISQEPAFAWRWKAAPESD